MRVALAVALMGMAMPFDVAGQTLGPRTLVPMHVLCADLPFSTPPGITLTIEGAQHADGRQVLGIGDTVVIKAGTGQGITVGQQFVARRQKRMSDVYARGRDGYGSVRTAGVVTVVAVDERFALARIERACDTVLVGDYLEPLEMPVLPTPAETGPANFDDRAAVLFGPDRRETFGDGDILTINRGATHGVAAGARFAIYRDPKQGLRLPLIELGEAVVVDVNESVSKAVLVRVKDLVETGDVAVPRGPAQP